MFLNLVSHKVFISLVALVFLSHFLSPHGADLGMAGLGVMFLITAANRVRTRLEVKYLQLFLVALLATIIIAIVHYKTAKISLEEYGVTLFMVGCVALFIALLDVVAYQARLLKIDIVQLAKLCSYAVIVSVIIKVIWVCFSKEPFSFEHVLLGSSRNAFLSGNLNPNKADDLFYFHITALLFFNSILILKQKLDWKLGLASFLVGFYMLMSFSITGSKGAFLGVIAGFTFVMFLLMWKKNWQALGWYGGVFAVIAVTIVSFNSPRLQKFYSKIEMSSLISTQAFASQIEKTLTVDDEKQFTEQEKKNIAAVKHKDRPEDVEFWNRHCTNENNEAEQIASNGFDNSSNVRIAMWKDGIQIWKQHPWLGFGEYDGDRLARELDLKTPCLVASYSHLHNHYLDILIRGGVLSLAVFTSFYCLLIYALVSVLLSKHTFSLAAAPLLIHTIYLGVENFFDVTLIDNASQRSMLLSLSVMVAILFAITNYADKDGRIAETHTG